ncbi:MAG TPA: right-handed parallel beta-helix repeat-containing protein, partial [Gemmatimonadales bacterium]|nr:right-handed parallel beta-helix repeat-containing protein [Gemmatimonadales bacterium]
MQTLRRIVAVLIFPAIAYLGAACERMDTPTAPKAVPPISAATYAPPNHWVNDDDPTPLNGYAPPGTSCADPGYATIKAALAAAASGQVIQVCVGMYTENDTLNKRLTLLGAQVGEDARGRADSESVVIPFFPATPTLDLQAGPLGSSARGSIIDGFTFLGGAFPGGGGHSGAIESTSGSIDSLQILNNRIRGFTAGSGVFLNNNGINITVNQNEIDGTLKVGGGGLFHLDSDNFDGFWFTDNNVVNGMAGTGFFVDGNRNVDKSTPGARAPLFSGNLIDRNGTGVNLGSRAWGDGPITGNTFSNNAFDGLQAGPKSTRISQNIFDNNGRNGLALTAFSLLPSTDPTRGAQGDTVTQNCFIGNGFPMGGAGISFSPTQFPGTISSNVVHQNNIFGNFIGARYLRAGSDTETIHAEFNWWGSSTGPTHPSNLGGTGDPVVDNGPLLPGGIDFDPWLTSAAGGTSCAPPAAPPGKVTGGGQVPVDMMGGKGSFGFNAKSDGGLGSGHLNYLNHATGAHIDCTVDAVTMLTDTTAEFSGTCTSNAAANAMDF